MLWYADLCGYCVSVRVNVYLHQRIMVKCVAYIYSNETIGVITPALPPNVWLKSEHWTHSFPYSNSIAFLEIIFRKILNLFHLNDAKSGRDCKCERLFFKHNLHGLVDSISIFIPSRFSFFFRTVRFIFVYKLSVCFIFIPSQFHFFSFGFFAITMFALFFLSTL